MPTDTPTRRSVARLGSLIGGIIILLLLEIPGHSAVPDIEGEASGIEICTQFICGEAIFIGTYSGKMGSETGDGVFLIRVQHDGLPDAGGQARLVGGVWNIRMNRYSLQGNVQSGLLTDLGNGIYRVEAIFEFQNGRAGNLHFLGELNHNILPPVVKGRLGPFGFL